MSAAAGGVSVVIADNARKVSWEMSETWGLVALCIMVFIALVLVLSDP